jgi:hypothetical protein
MLKLADKENDETDISHAYLREEYATFLSYQ